MPNSFKWLFDNIQPQPLTEEQRLACVDQSQCQLLIAAAGSGKTSTMVGKVAYNIASGQLQPQEILVLAFNVSAANELSQRISSSLFNVLGKEVNVKTSTLHALGLQIMLSCNADVKVLNDGDNKKLIQKIIYKFCKKDTAFADSYLSFLTFYYANFANPYDFEAKRQWQQYIKNNGFKLNKYHGFLTIQGELVFTQFEQAIANWLYAHGIKYVYTYSKTNKILKHVLSRYRFGDLRYQAYFELVDYDIKINCVRAQSDSRFIKYKKRLKRDSKNKSNTVVRKQIFLSAKQFAKNKLFKRLNHIFKLLRINVLLIDFYKLTKQRSYLSELTLNDYQLDFLQSFIRSDRLRFKNNNSNNLEKNAYNDVHDKDIIDRNVVNTNFSNSNSNLKSKSAHKNYLERNRINIHKPFLEKLCIYYSQYLLENNLIDFEGMLLDAAQHVNNGRFQSKYKLILVDEFQDTSGASINLLLSLLKQSPDNKIFAVGDDWQSIYGFAGAIPDVMFNFSSYFAGYKCKLSHLTNTFRFNQHIADTASNFVQANPMQIKKQVIAHTSADPHSIKLRYCTSVYAMYLICHQCLLQINNDLENRLNQNDKNLPRNENNSKCKTDLTDNIYVAHKNKDSTKNKKLSVYILGRYKHQQPPEIETWQTQFPKLNIQFSTVHAAKGMQADSVIILGLHMGKYGFPSQVKSDVLYSLVSNVKEDFPYAQERRLFYVALTRTKGDIYLLAGRRNPSPFIAEVASAILPENII